MYTGRKTHASLSYVITVRGEVKTERAREATTPYELSLALPHHTLAGWPPMCVFVMVNEA
jgi:hypothetical protein